MVVRPPRVVVTGPWSTPGWDERLRAAGCDLVVGPSIDDQPSAAIAENELRRMLDGADAVLVSSRERLSRALIAENAKTLRIVAKATIGVERIDVCAATDCGVLVVNSPAPENIIGLAEATVGLIVALAKRLVEKEARLRAGGWRDASTDGLVLSGRTIGIVGLGRVGGGVGRRLSGWDADLVGCDPYVSADRFEELGVRPATLGELLAVSDVVTVHVPLTDETRGFIGAAQLSSMRRGALLVNTSRGEVLDEAALIAAVESGHLGAAALDVFHREPLPSDSPLRATVREKLLLTPHSIGSSLASRGTGTKMAIAAILTALDGRVPDNVVNPEVVERWLERWSRAAP